MSFEWLPRKAFFIDCALSEAQILDALERAFGNRERRRWLGMVLPGIEFERGRAAFRIDKSLSAIGQRIANGTELIGMGTIAPHERESRIHVEYAVVNAVLEIRLWFWTVVAGIASCCILGGCILNSRSVVDVLTALLTCGILLGVPWLHKLFLAGEIDSLHAQLLGVLERTAIKNKALPSGA